MSHLDPPIGHPNRAWLPPDGNDSDSMQALLAKLTKRGTPEQRRTTKKKKTPVEKTNDTTDNDFGFATASDPPTNQGQSSSHQQKHKSRSLCHSPDAGPPSPPNGTTPAPVPASATATATTQANLETEPASMTPHPSPPACCNDNHAKDTPVDGNPGPFPQLLNDEEESDDNNLEQNETSENLVVDLDGRFQNEAIHDNSKMVTTRQAAKRKSPPGTTTTRQQKKKSKVQSKIKVGGRVFSTRNRRLAYVVFRILIGSSEERSQVASQTRVMRSRLICFQQSRKRLLSSEKD